LAKTVGREDVPLHRENRASIKRKRKQDIADLVNALSGRNHMASVQARNAMDTMLELKPED
jgi:hypothetical protein